MLDSSIDHAAVRAEVDETGFALFPAYLDEAFCAPVRAFIDAFDPQASEINYGGSEKRVWMAHEKNALVGKFRTFADGLLSQLYGKQIASRDTLAIRNLPVEQTPNLIEGRWHLDSLGAQIKVFAFLTEVTERSGPLEIVAGSHRSEFKLRHTLGGHLLAPGDFLGKTRKYQRLDDAWVERVAARGGTPLTCAAGTVAVVNTSAVHRARPCLESNRYALTSYYDRF